MNDAEREMIAGLFQRIRSVEAARRDPQAEDFIAEQVARQPHAPYAMAQTIVVQDRSIEAAKARIEALERELEDAREAAEQAQPSTSAGPSPWGPRAQESMARAEASRGGFRQGEPYDDRQGMSPPFGAPRQDDRYQPGYGAPAQSAPRYEQPSSGGGFLSGALQTAAGVAAGALVFQGVRSMFGGGEEGKSGSGDAARAEGAGQSGEGGDGATKEIGDWFSGVFGGSGDKQDASNPPADDDKTSAGLFGGGDDNDDDDGGDWA